MDEDDQDIGRRPPQLKNLDDMSIEALHAYLAELDAEMARVRTAIAAKEQARIGANTLFKVKGES